MKVGVSTYSLFQAQMKGEMTFLQILEWIKESGADHIEVVAFQGDFVSDHDFVKSVADKAKALDIPIEAYSTGINTLTDETLEEQIKLAYRHLDVANELGASIVRFDLVDWSALPSGRTIDQFDLDLPKLVSGAQKIADYAKQYNITVTVENHGMYVNGGERVKRLITAVDRDNYKCTLDVGNVLCVDEDPILSVDVLLPVAATVHFKDFYIRKDPVVVGEGFSITTPLGNLLRGAIVGHGDIDTKEIVNRLKKHNYQGALSIEFEGLEDPKVGTKTGLDNIKNMLNKDF